ncbi:MAG: hypothetical protein IID38_01000 [Planctomycetes bacterium]|nr:hypothetical protein [Planctomycetota bacterium]
MTILQSRAQPEIEETPGGLTPRRNPPATRDEATGQVRYLLLEDPTVSVNVTPSDHRRRSTTAPAQAMVSFVGWAVPTFLVNSRNHLVGMAHPTP